MIRTVTSFTSSGLKDWLVQRASAVVIAAYVLYCLALSCTMSEAMSYETLVELFSGAFFRGFSLLFLMSLVAHAWIGMWTIYTDYIKCSVLRLFVQLATILALIGFLIWGVFILWGIV